ncbi:MAG: hypothetical protein EOP84_03820 [Verrucomicrobiaceae bacterium]|nr:MAG: hypothetical protein EOP84_03820 [Verrucomicrobiaceae bacterium]
MVALSIFGAPKLKPEGFKTAEAYHQAQLPFIFHHYLSILLLPLLVLVGSLMILFAYNQGRSHPRP